ncbi:MAG: hypothetical protein LH467_15270 [Gemmatimonadaceae bacterium]|nr:hypothetical protein [Gemmatimonadaceae bacterium]
MTDFLSGFTAKILPRLAGILAAYLVGEAGKRGLTLDPEQTTTLMIAAYAFLHRAISKHTNPGDATKTSIIDYQKRIVAGAAPVSDGVAASSAPAQPNTWESGKDTGLI